MEFNFNDFETNYEKIKAMLEKVSNIAFLYDIFK